MTPLRASPLAAPLLIAVIALTSCDDPTAVSPAAAAPAQSTVTRGPIIATVSADPGEATVGQPITLTIDVTAENDVAVTMPVLEETLGVFDVIAADTPPDVPEGTTRRTTHRYTISTLEAGETEIPALSIGFRDQRADDTKRRDIEGEFATDPLTVAVETFISGEFDPTALRDIKGEVDVPLPNRARTLAIVGAIVGGLLVTLAIFWIAQRSRRTTREEARPQIAPGAWALRELARLQADDLIDRDVPGYYVRLTDIVRQYIERRFGLSAPERTTDEFLREAQDHRALGDDHKRSLADFLRAADMVKFARYEPPRADSEAALGAAAEFVEQTAEVARPVQGAAA